MRGINRKCLILEPEAFERSNIEKRLSEGGFNSIARFEQFIWDLEMFLQLQRKLGDNIILKGGAAAQFYIPIASQRTSIDIDMICRATPDEVHAAVSEIEDELCGEREYCKFRIHKPQNPKLELSDLETYYIKVPSICGERELFTSGSNQEVKIEFLFSALEYPVEKIRNPVLFALETDRYFNVLALEHLLADKLTTLGPTTIGIPEERADEQFKQIYDLVTLFISNYELIIAGKERIKENYEAAAGMECRMRRIPYDPQRLFRDMRTIIGRIMNIENDGELLRRAYDFQSLYLRKSVNRDKAEWAIAGYQLALLVGYILKDDTKILNYRKIAELCERLRFEDIHGPDRGRLNKEARIALVSSFGRIEEELSTDIFKKRMDRIIWELASKVPLSAILEAVNGIP